MLKPQKIKDQEFPIKFKGYDPIEVRNYLEIVADNFFELEERNRSLVEELDTLKLDTLSAAEKKEDDKQGGTVYDFQLVEEDEEDTAAQITNALNEPGSQRLEPEKDAAEAAEARIAALTNDNIVFMTRIKDLTAQLHKEQVKNKNLQEENDALRKEENSFKKTILAAQNFADNIKKSAEQEAQRIIEKAKESVDIYLREMDEKAEYLPAQIEELEKRKFDVRQELKSVLEGYMAVLDLENLSDELGAAGRRQKAAESKEGEGESTR